MHLLFALIQVELGTCLRLLIEVIRPE